MATKIQPLTAISGWRIANAFSNKLAGVVANYDDRIDLVVRLLSAWLICDVSMLKQTTTDSCTGASTPAAPASLDRMNELTHSYRSLTCVAVVAGTTAPLRHVLPWAGRGSTKIRAQLHIECCIELLAKCALYGVVRSYTHM